MLARIFSKSPIYLPNRRHITSATNSIKSAIENPTPGNQIISGWVKSCRRQKNIAFAEINDGSNVKGIQVVLKKGLDEGITIGSAVQFIGTIQETVGREQFVEFRAISVEILGTSDAENYPIPNTKQGIPPVLLRQNAHFRPRTSVTSAMLRVRSEMAWAANDYLRKTGFINVQTPLITSSDCEGAGEVFTVISGPTPSPPNSTTAAIDLPPLSIPKYLTVSSQLHLEALASSLPKVYTLSPAFRAEKSDTARHLQEFWMLEIELAFLPLEEREGLEKVMEVTEGVMRAVIDHALLVNREELDFFDSKEPGLVEMLKMVSSSSSFPRVNYEEAMQLVMDHSDNNPAVFAFKPKSGGVLATEHEKYLAEEVYKGPVFIINYPRDQKPFYMLPNLESPEEMPTSACFDLLIPRLGELAGGSLREHREKELKQMMRERGIKEENYEWYLELRKFGSTRHGGFGMGWERLVSFVTGLINVRDCIAFPRAAEGSRF